MTSWLSVEIRRTAVSPKVGQLSAAVMESCKFRLIDKVGIRTQRPVHMQLNRDPSLTDINLVIGVTSAVSRVIYLIFLAVILIIQTRQPFSTDPSFSSSLLSW